MIRFKMWMVLACICVFIKGVSFSNNCSEIRNISFSPGEPITLPIDEDGVEDTSLVDSKGTEIARINKSGVLTVLDERYKDKISAKGFSFHVQNTTIMDEKKFTVSVLYRNGAHCSQHYLVKQLLDFFCSEKTEIGYILPDGSFTLVYESAEVDEITWVNESGNAIAVTKAKLQILDSDYEGNVSLISVTLRKPNATLMAQEHYTARVLFRNGTRCLQHYLAIVPGFEWYRWFMPEFKPTTLLAFLIIIIIFSLAYMKKRNDLLKIRNKSEEKQRKTLLQFLHPDAE